MKRIFISLLPICCSFYASEQGSRQLVEIEKEIAALQSRKKELQSKIDIEHYLELQQEMKGQRSSLEYHWHDLSKEMKAAEASEQKAHRMERELEALNERLTKILAEKETNTL